MCVYVCVCMCVTYVQYEIVHMTMYHVSRTSPVTARSAPYRRTSPKTKLIPMNPVTENTKAPPYTLRGSWRDEESH